MTARSCADAVVVTGVPGVEGRAGYRLRRAAEVELGRRQAADVGVVVVDIWIAPGRDTRRVRSGPQRPADDDTPAHP